jgi:hypothetical protein
MKIHRYPVQLRGPSRASSVARSRLGIDWLNRIVAALSASQQQPFHLSLGWTISGTCETLYPNYTRWVAR